MCAIFWIYQIGKRSSIKHSKTRNTTKNLKICMRPWIRSYQLFLDFCPRRAFLAAPGSSWQLLAAPRGRKIVITRRSWQLQSSYFACADLWTCWIRFWYSRSPKLTKIICFWWYSFLLFFIFFIFLYFFMFSPVWGLVLGSFLPRGIIKPDVHATRTKAQPDTWSFFEWTRQQGRLQFS